MFAFYILSILLMTNAAKLQLNICRIQEGGAAIMNSGSRDLGIKGPRAISLQFCDLSRVYWKTLWSPCPVR